MPYQYVLANLLADHPEAVGVLFLDDSGETVDFACADGNPYEIQLMGAYLGIYLRQLGEMTRAVDLGTIRILHIERTHEGQDVRADHLALVQRQPAPVATTRRRLGRAARAIAREVFDSEIS